MGSLASVDLTALVVGLALGLVFATIPMPILRRRLRAEQQRTLREMTGDNPRLAAQVHRLSVENARLTQEVHRLDTENTHLRPRPDGEPS